MSEVLDDIFNSSDVLLKDVDIQTKYDSPTEWYKMLYEREYPLMIALHFSCDDSKLENIKFVHNKIMYIAGDTDNTKEAQKVKCNIAFVPVGGTYTMTAKEAADLVRIIKPDIAVPIHYKTIVGSVEDATNFKELLKDEVRVEILMN